MKLQQPVWLCLAALSLVAAQSAVPSNTSSYIPAAYNNSDVKLVLTTPAGDGIIFDLYPLTSQAYDRLPHTGYVPANLLLNTPGNVGHSVNTFPPTGIAFTSCQSSDYAGFTTMQDSIEQAVSSKALAILFYATGSNYCNLTGLSANNGYNILYTMTNANKSISLYNDITGNTTGNVVRLYSQAAYDDSSSTSGSLLGGAASTAIAMIILYAITGIITCLFLVIIITGAVRAHRHPERYGPRNVLGIPTQSRAKGIARAMLETIPIVKFGEQNTAAKDLEGRGVESSAQSHEMTNQAPQRETQPVASSSDEPAPSGILPAISTSIPTASDATRTPIAESSTALQPDTAISPATHEDPETQTCSICTDDFALGQDIRLLPCNHAFHPACVDPWLLDVSGTCPLCRVDLRPAEDGLEASVEGGTLPPPLDPEAAEREGVTRRDGGRRRSVMSFFSNRRGLERAGREERIEALRRWHETNGVRRWHETHGAGSSTAAATPGADVAAGEEAETAGVEEDITRRHSRLGGLSRLIRRGRGTGPQ